MTGWLFVTLLGTLGNTVLLLRWQLANEARMDIHWQKLREQQKQIKELLPMLNHVSRQLATWEAWRNSTMDTTPPRAQEEQQP